MLGAPALARAQANRPLANTAPPAAAAAAQTVIEPANALERSFVAAADNETERAAFRRLFLDSRVALVLTVAGADAAPAQISLPSGQDVCLIFTSAARAREAMQREAPLAMLTGRQALQRIRGANVVININLVPRLVLDAAGVADFLAVPEQAAPPAPARTPAPPAAASAAAPGVRAPDP